MKFQKIDSTAKAYTFKNAKLGLPTQQPAISTIFDGKLVYLGFKDYGFQPMIKVLEKTTDELYFFPSAVAERSKESSNFITDSKYSNTIGEFSEQEVTQAYQNSGTKFNLGDWLKSDGGKKIVNDSISLGLDLIRDKGIKNTPSSQTAPAEYTPLKPEDQPTGMTPLTIGIIVVSSIIVIAIGVAVFKNKPKTITK